MTVGRLECARKRTGALNIPEVLAIPESARSLHPSQAATMDERFATPGETGKEAVQESNGAESLHLNDAPA